MPQEDFIAFVENFSQYITSHSVVNTQTTNIKILMFKPQPTAKLFET